MKVLKIEARVKPGRAASLVFGFDALPDVEGLYAEIELDKGSTLLLSTFGEGWKLDGMWSPKGLPVFQNGFGSMLSRLVTDDVQEILNAAFARQEVTV